MPVEDTERLLAAAEAAERDGLDDRARWAGRAARRGEPGRQHEMLGLIAAAVILLIMFGSVVAAGLPLAMAIGGLAVSSSLVGLAAAVVDVPDFAPTIGAVLGLALGIDYALLMVTRFREWRAVGLDPEAATVATLDTAGRAVLVAGGTVMVSMLGLFAVGLSIMNGTAVVTMVATLVVMVAAITLFPALLGYLGRRIDRLRLPLGRRRAAQISADGHLVPAAGWTRWSRLVQRHSVLATVASVVLLLVLAAPFLGVHFGLPDAGNDPEGTSSRQAYDMLAEGFGPGANGPLLVVADLSRGDARGRSSGCRPNSATRRVSRRCRRHGSIPAGDTALITVVPTTGPQEAATEDLVTDPARRRDPGRDRGHRHGRSTSAVRPRDDRPQRVDRRPARAAHRRRRPRVDAPAAGGVPQRRHRGHGGRDESAVGGGGATAWLPSSSRAAGPAS